HRMDAFAHLPHPSRTGRDPPRGDELPVDPPAILRPAAGDLHHRRLLSRERPVQLERGILAAQRRRPSAHRLSGQALDLLAIYRHRHRARHLGRRGPEHLCRLGSTMAGLAGAADGALTAMQAGGLLALRPAAAPATRRGRRLRWAEFATLFVVLPLVIAV